MKDSSRRLFESPKIISWGIGEGRPPLTSDPENPIKPFAVYSEDKK